MKNSIKERSGKTSINDGDVKKMLRDIMRIRLLEERIVELYPEQEIRCPVHLSIGQEAVAVGVCAALAKKDAVMSGHRAHAHYLAKGGNLKRMLAEMYGKETGCCKGRGGSMHLIDLSVNFLGSTPIVGGTIPVATGVAWGYKLQHKQRAVVVFLGEGATEEGVWHESINFAQLHKLPIIYVCENNLYSVYTPLGERQPSRKISGIAKAHGLATLIGHGNDVSAVYAISKEARSYVMSGAGPVFMELDTYRWREHCGTNYDNHIGYRTEKEFQEWKEKDPLVLTMQRAMKQGVSDKEIALMQKSIAKEIDKAVAFAKESPFPAKL